MSGIPSNILYSLRDTLAKCEPFETDRSLRTLFVDERINLWRDRLPQADTVINRVDALVNYLYDKKNRDGSSGLVLFLKALIDATKSQDGIYDQLVELLMQLSQVFGESTATLTTTHHDVPASNSENTARPAKHDSQPELVQGTTQDKRDFFISYNRHDRQTAEWIAWQLEGAGYTTIIQAWDFRPGSNFVADMQMAATNVKRTIAVLSPEYLASNFTQPEWNAAFAQDPTGMKGILLPVKIRECELTGLLPQIVYIDLVGLSESEAKEVLLAGVRRDRAKPTTAPDYKK